MLTYNKLGQLKRSTVPTEITSSYAPAGDDSGGWLWKEQKYDWNGRVVEKINTDGTNRLISYSGCGCAGGQIATLKGEEVPRDDQPTTNARRTTKVYTDILGRSYKTEILAWDGTTVYKSTVKTFNGRNQVVEIKETDHERDPNVDQISTITYDGHGRPKTRHNPIEDSSAYTKLFYNDDDSINYSIDPRQVITNFTYNDPRGLLTKITYQRPAGSENTIPLTPDVEIDYDSLGNRTTLDDGSGSTSYSYDELSRLTSETKTFSGLSGSFTLSYSYHINGKLKSVTDPFGAVVNYNDDEVGRTTSITGSGYQSVSTYASNIKHRAFGGIKELDYGSGDNSEVSYEYDTRLRVSDYSATSNVLSGGFVRKAAYDYFDDNRVEVAHNLVNDSFDQTFAYDQMGRTTKNEFGTAIDDDEEEVTTYSQSLQYDGFSQITSRITNVWGGGDGFTATYANGRKQNSNWLYDAAGNFIDNTTSPTVYDRNGYDEAGNQTETIQRYYQGAPQQTSFDRTVEIENSFDGDERLVKRIETNTSQQVWPPNLPPNITSKTEYFLHSTVLGKALVEIDDQGAREVTYVYTGDSVIAELRDQVFWKHLDPVTESYQKVFDSGAKVPTGGSVPGSAEIGPLGEIVPQNDPDFSSELGGELFPNDYAFGADVNQPENGCTWDRVPIPCNMLRGALQYAGRWHLEVNIRSSGGYGILRSLRSNVQLIRSEVRRKGDWRIDKSVQLKSSDDDIVIEAEPWTTVAYLYTVTMSPFFETAVFLLPTESDERILSESAVLRLREDLSTLLRNPECAQYVKDLLKEAQQVAKDKDTFEKLRSDDPRFIFDTVAATGTFTLGNTSTTVTGSLFWWRIPASWRFRESQRPSVKIGFNYFFPSDFASSRWAGDAYTKRLFDKNRERFLNEGGLVALHELLHFNFHDLTLASAAARLAGEPDTFKGLLDKDLTNDDIGDASIYYHKQLKEKCGNNGSQ